MHEAMVIQTWQAVGRVLRYGARRFRNTRQVPLLRIVGELTPADRRKRPDPSIVTMGVS